MIIGQVIGGSGASCLGQGLRNGMFSRQAVNGVRKYAKTDLGQKVSWNSELE